MQLSAVPRPTAPRLPPALVDAAARAEAFFTKLGVTPDEGNGPVEFRVDRTQLDASYSAQLDSANSGPAAFSDEHVLVGSDPFTGAPFWQSPEVVYHELAHRVTQHIVPGLGADPMSNVVSEALADTFAAAIDGNWVLGDGIVPDGIRSAIEPGSQLTLDATGAEQRIPTATKVDDITPESLARGPYVNIGPLTHAAYLMSERIGLEPMARIHLEALRHHLPATAGVTDLVLGTVHGAGTLFGAGSEEQLAVRDAWKAVGVRAAAVDSIA